MINSKKWHKFRASKNMFPTVQIDGEGTRKGSLVVGMKKAQEYLEQKLGFSLKDAVKKGNSHEWVFKFLVGKVPERN